MKSKTIILAAALCGFMFTAAFAQTADTIYHNGSILTMAGKDPTYVEALAVKDGKIVFAGARDAALKMKGDSTRVVDLSGKTLLPGFLDGHSHYINSLLVANQCKLYAPPSGVGKDVPSIIAELKRYAAERKIPKGEIIMGYGYDDTVMPDGRLLNRDDLDEAFPDNPVRIEHVSMHGAVMNSLALKYYEISAETETPAGGVIVRKPGTNEPWGLIMETAFIPVNLPCGSPLAWASSSNHSVIVSMFRRQPSAPQSFIVSTRVSQLHVSLGLANQAIIFLSSLPGPGRKLLIFSVCGSGSSSGM